MSRISNTYISFLAFQHITIPHPGFLLFLCFQLSRLLFQVTSADPVCYCLGSSPGHVACYLLAVTKLQVLGFLFVVCCRGHSMAKAAFLFARCLGLCCRLGRSLCLCCRLGRSTLATCWFLFDALLLASWHSRPAEPMMSKS